MTLDPHSMSEMLLWGTGVLIVAILAVRVSSGVGLPSLLFYLAIGVLLGELGFGLEFTDPTLALSLGYFALVIILAEGGLTTSWPHIRPVMRLGVALATIGVLISVLVVAATAHYFLGMSWQLAIILGAVCSPTDAAAVFSVLRRVPVTRKMMGTLEAESGFNDAPVVVLVTLMSADLGHGPAYILGEVALELVIGIAFGVGIGWLGGQLIRRAALPSSGLYPIAVMSLALMSYAAAVVAHGSGFAAVYVTALILGNLDLPHRTATRSFSEGLAWIAQIGLFVMLGLLASPGRFTGETLVFALIIGTVVTFIARPLAIFASQFFQRITLREQAFLSMAGLRGAVPIVFTTIPLAAQVPGAEQVFDLVFIFVVIATLLTAPALPRLALALGVSRRSEPRDLDVEAAPLERIAADLLQVRVTPKSMMHGVEVGELRLPPGSLVALIVREGETLVPEGRTVLRRGDDVLVVTPRKDREAVQSRLREVSLGGRLAKWIGPRP